MSDTAVAESGTRLQNFLDHASLRGFPWKTATILYTISWGWLFIVRDSYWADDWNSFLHPEITPFDYEALGLAPWTELNQVFFDLFGPGVFRLVTFCFYFGSGVVVFGITKSTTFLSLIQRKQVVLLFLLLPFNSARVALMVFHYTTAYFAFFLAWYLLVCFASPKTHFLSLALFFLSFGMHSLLPFYLLPALQKFLLSNMISLRNFCAFARKNFVMLMMPVFYWVMRSVFWPERDLYHDVSLTRLSGTTSFVLFSGLILLLAFILQRKMFAIKRTLQIIFVGVLCLFFGTIAYSVVGFFPDDLLFFSKFFETFLGRSDWYSRHQTLQPLGVALLIVGFVGLLPKFLKKLTRSIQAFILAICVVFNIGFGFEYVVDHSKQKEVIGVLKEEGESRLGSDYQFVDQTTLLNARGRAYRERDWRGLIYLAYGIESMRSSRVETMCKSISDARLVLIQGPETHWQALKNWFSDRDMGFKVTVDDTPGACKPEMVTSEKVSGAIPILFYFTGAKG